MNERGQWTYLQSIKGIDPVILGVCEGDGEGGNEQCLKFHDTTTLANDLRPNVKSVSKITRFPLALTFAVLFENRQGPVALSFVIDDWQGVVRCDGASVLRCF